MGWGVFCIFLLICAGEDLWRRAVDVWVYLVFGCIAVGLTGWHAAGLPADGWKLAADALAGFALGAGLLAVGWICPGGIGTGDGLFFCVSGLYLGLWNNLLLLWLTSMLSGLFCLGYYVWGKLIQRKNLGLKTVPFLTFAAVPGIWMTAQAFGRLLAENRV